MPVKYCYKGEDILCIQNVFKPIGLLKVSKVNMSIGFYVEEFDNLVSINGLCI